jgi:hypothetical protein
LMPFAQPAVRIALPFSNPLHNRSKGWAMN